MDPLGPGDGLARRRYVRRDRPQAGADRLDQAHHARLAPDHAHRLRGRQAAGGDGAGRERTHSNALTGRPMQRVVITGLGALTPVGNDVPTTWRALLEGRSGIASL